MGRIEELEKILNAMTRGEKAELLQWIARDLGDAFPGIDSTSDVVEENHVLSAQGFPFGY